MRLPLSTIELAWSASTLGFFWGKANPYQDLGKSKKLKWMKETKTLTNVGAAARTVSPKRHYSAT
jgi:hypothetical protein